jgi:mannose-6-phosphate isomerase-like protein (cupin superfamily)
MTQAYFKSSPLVISAPDGRTIEEHFGRTTTGDENISIARMLAPPGWAEPYQCPEFDEHSLIVRGKKMVEVNGEEVVLTAGESMFVRKGARVRYSNPFDEEAEYWTICIPAFSPETAHREQDGDNEV